MNQLFLTFLTDLEREARRDGNKVIGDVYRKAKKNLVKYPLPLLSGEEATIVKGISSFVAGRLDERLAAIQANKENNPDVLSNDNIRRPSTWAVARANSACIPFDGITVDLVPNATQKPRKSKKSDIIKSKQDKSYLPKPTSGAGAIVRALARLVRKFDSSSTVDTEIRWFSKEAIITEATPLCEASFLADGEGHYTAWSSIKTLQKHSLVEAAGRPLKYRITQAGMVLATKLDGGNTQDVASVLPMDVEEELQIPSRPLARASSSSTSLTRSSSSTISVDMDLSEFNYDQDIAPEEPALEEPEERDHVSILRRERVTSVFIAIDNREKTHGSSTKSFFEHLQRHKCPCETRQLDLGDFIWVGKTQSGEEVVLDTIVERKQISDLVASFKDRRYKEQKFRLTKSGIENVIYLVEGEIHAARYAQGISSDMIEQSLASTEFSNGFIVQRTKSTHDTIQYLRNITSHLQQRYVNQLVSIISDEDIIMLRQQKKLSAPPNSGTIVYTMTQFAAANNKRANLSPQEVFATHLMVYHGCSAEKGLAIAAKYPSHMALWRAMTEFGVTEALKVKRLADIKTVDGRRIGPVLAKLIYLGYTETKK